jgi:hypothetical protein
MSDASPWGGGGMDWASLPTKPREDLPTSVVVKGREVPIYTFAQIDRVGKSALKQRAMNLKDMFGSGLPRFSPGMPVEQMVAWLLEAQTIVAASVGVSLTVADLGAPKGGDGVGAYLAHLKSPQRPSPSPQQLQQQHHHQQQPAPQHQQSEEYQVEGILDVRTAPNGMATHFLIKWDGYPVEESTWESAAKMQALAPEICFQFKQQFQQQLRQPPPQQQYQPPPQQHYHQQQMYQTDFRGQGTPHQAPRRDRPDYGAPPTPGSGSSTASMRPDQEADAAAAAIRKRAMGSNPLW